MKTPNAIANEKLMADWVRQCAVKNVLLFFAIGFNEDITKPHIVSHPSVDNETILQIMRGLVKAMEAGSIDNVIHNHPHSGVN